MKGNKKTTIVSRQNATCVSRNVGRSAKRHTQYNIQLVSRPLLEIMLEVERQYQLPSGRLTDCTYY